MPDVPLKPEVPAVPLEPDVFVAFIELTDSIAVILVLIALNLSSRSLI